MPHPAPHAASADITTSIIAKTMAYLAVPSIVGYERPFMDFLAADFKALGLNVIRHEGLLEVSGANPLSGILCAHIDRHGLISLGGGEYVYAAQYIKEIRYGENNRASQKEVESIAKRFEGERVYAYHPETGAHIAEGLIERCDADLRSNGDVVFTISGLEGLTHEVGQGIPLAYARVPSEKDGFLRGQIDNALSVATVHALFQGGFQGTALLATEEEIGKSWVHINRWLDHARIRTHSLIVLDTSPYTDQAPIETGMVILRNRDMTHLFNPALVKNLKTRCLEINMPFQVKDEMLLASGKTIEQLGSTELGKVIRSSEGRYSGATVQIPTLMYHTCNETTSQLAIRDYYRFLHNILIEDPLPFMNTIYT
jgi:hypothetical protein